MKYTKEKLEESISKSQSWADVCREFGVKPATGAQTHIKKQAEKFEIDFSHFLGQGWRKGKEFLNEKVPLETYLNNEKRINSHKLKIKLFKSGLKDKKCEVCGIREWLGREVVLELDHKDGNHYNNNLSNLQVLCPNCHAYKTRWGIDEKVAMLVLETSAK